MASENHDNGGTRVTALWFGVALGAAIGIGIALSRSRRPSRWRSARDFGEKLAGHAPDLTHAGRDILDRVRTIYDEGCRVVEEVGELWDHGRKLVKQ